MGIQGFYFKWLFKQKQHFVDTFQQNLPSNVLSFSIDFNSIIHTNAQRIYGYGDFWKKKYKDDADNVKKKRLETIEKMSNEELEKELFTSIGIELIKLVSRVNPRLYILLAVDGVAPQAKIAQQRSRRYRNAKEYNETLRFDPNSITPGTEFMFRLNTFMEGWIQNNSRRLSNIIYYSSHLFPGEGEHKIMEYFRNNRFENIDEPGTEAPGSHVVYGMDTDLIMLVMGLQNRNIYLWREDVNDILNIDSLKYNISLRMGRSISAVEDFIFILFMFGNDFLPGQVSLDDFTVSIDNLLNIYKYLHTNYKMTITKRTLEDITINWEGLRLFLFNVKYYEPMYLNHESKRHFIQKNGFTLATTEEYEFNFNDFRNYWYNHELGPRSNTDYIKSLYQQIDPTYDPFKITIDKIDNMCKSYVNGLLWTLYYYIKGFNFINLKWYYEYYHSPLIIDIYGYIESIKDNPNEILKDWMPLKGNSFIHVFHQLLSIIPPKSKKLIPAFLHFLMDNSSPLIDYYPKDFIIDYENKDQEWKGIPILPFVNPYRMINTFDLLVILDQNILLMYQVKPDIKYKRSVYINDLLCNVKRIKEKQTGKRKVKFRPKMTYHQGPYEATITDISYDEIKK